MKRGLITFSVVLCLTFAVKAKDIKLKDGEIIKDVRISSVTPNGIDISFKKDNTYFIRHILFTNLSEETQKEFHYNAKKAKEYEKNLHKHAETARKKYEEEMKEKAEADKKKHALLAQIRAGRINAILKVYSRKEDGVVAWCNNQADKYSTSGHMGKVFVYGLLQMKGGVSARNIYPTGTSRHGFPCYATSAEIAAILMANK